MPAFLSLVAHTFGPNYSGRDGRLARAQAFETSLGNCETMSTNRARDVGEHESIWSFGLGPALQNKQRNEWVSEAGISNTCFIVMFQSYKELEISRFYCFYLFIHFFVYASYIHVFTHVWRCKCICMPFLGTCPFSFWNSFSLWLGSSFFLSKVTWSEGPKDPPVSITPTLGLQVAVTKSGFSCGCWTLLFMC